MINFHCTKEEGDLIMQIVERGQRMAIRANRHDMAHDTHGAVMDITACHCNGCPLKLEDFFHADDTNFAHDFFGIYNNLNRETGQLDNFFHPRFARG